MIDVYGKALSDYYYNDNPDILWLHNSYDTPEEMPVDIFFRGESEMPDIEIQALKLCKGNILDVGAGVGSHSLILQKKGFDVTAVEISKSATIIMKERGVKQFLNQDFFQLKQKFDTLLFMMNGIGLVGTISNFKDTLIYLKTLLKPGGQVIFDSSDINYLYDDMQMPKDKYFGEISYCYEYKNMKGKWFNWLYIDPPTLQNLCQQYGWKCKIIFRNNFDQYLAQLSLI